MTSWKDDRNLGPWPFAKQPNKWGYLNNPNWVNNGVGPINYDGNESAEPIVWSIDPTNNVRTRGTQDKHNPCGHWHQPVTIPPGPQLFQDVTVTFTVFAGRDNGIVYNGNCFYPHLDDWPPTSQLVSWEGEFWYSDDNGETYTAVPDTYSSFTILDEFPWGFSVDVDPNLWSVPGRKFYVHYRGNGGGWVTTWLNFYWDSSITYYTYARFWVYTTDYPDGPTNSILVMRWQVGVSDYAIEPLDVALFDRDTGLMIEGSNIHFEEDELVAEKSVVIANGVFPFTHEVELRAKSNAASSHYAPYLQEASIYIDYQNILSFTNYQRIGVGSLNFGWGYAGNYDQSPYPWNGQEQLMWPDPTQVDLWSASHPPDDGFPGGYYRYGGIDASARQLVHKVSGMEIRYQACMESYRTEDPEFGWPYDPEYDCPEEYLYQALWNNSELDDDYEVGDKVVASSKVALTIADLYEWQKRYLLTSEDISDDIVDGNRYCQFQPSDYSQPIYPMNAALLCTKRGNGEALDLPDTFIYLIACASFQSYSATPNPVTPPTSFRPWDPNKYDGSITTWFEVTYANRAAENRVITLVDEDGVVYATLTLPVTLPVAGWPWQFNTVRVEFTPPTNPKNLGFSISGATNTRYISIKSAYIRIRQTGATKSRVHVPMLSFNMDWGMAGSLNEDYVGASAEVMTGGEYLPNFDEPDYLSSWSWAMDACVILKMGNV